jgi:large subunit ribosomal protein L17e
MAIKFSREIPEGATVAKGSMDNAKVSYKKTWETCHTLRSRRLLDAIQFLKNVLERKECVPCVRYNSGCRQTHQARKYGLRKVIRFPSGEKTIKRTIVQTRGIWPTKSAKLVIELLDAVKEDGVSKGLNPSELVITHVQVNRAPVIYGRTFRAHGRITPFNKKPCHIQVIAEVVPSNNASIEE